MFLETLPIAFSCKRTSGPLSKQNDVSNVFWVLVYFKRPYYKSKLELKSNSSEILPVNCKFICDFIPS